MNSKKYFTLQYLLSNKPYEPLNEEQIKEALDEISKTEKKLLEIDNKDNFREMVLDAEIYTEDCQNYGEIVSKNIRKIINFDKNSYKWRIEGIKARMKSKEDFYKWYSDSWWHGKDKAVEEVKNVIDR